MKVQCHRLKKQQSIFSASPAHCYKQDCCKWSLCQAFHGPAAATRHFCGKVEARARKSAGCPSCLLVSSQCTGTDTAPAAPMGHGMSCGGSTYWSNSISPTHRYGNRAMAGSAVVQCGRRHSYSWSGCRRCLPWVGVAWAQGRDCKGPPRHAGLPPSLLSSSLCSQWPALGRHNIQELTMQSMTFKERKQLLNTS